MDFRELLTQPKPGVAVVAVRWVLRALSVPFWLIVHCRNQAYDWHLLSSYESSLPVVSVGNLSVGGTGKSPVVSWLAGWLRTQDLRVAILSRGYGQLADGQNDEALELELLHPDVPHLQHWDRIASAKLAEEELEMQILLLDDGFQHRRLRRNLDIVLVDSTDTASARWLLPGGLMREPMSSLRRADAVILTRTDHCAAEHLETLRRQVQRLAPQAALVEACHQPQYLHLLDCEPQPCATLTGKNVLAFCGIGNPASFFNSLDKLGANVLDRQIWPDHHAYSKEDVVWLEAWTQSHPTADLLICTMKDWVKLLTQQIAGKPLAALKIELSMGNGKAQLVKRLEQLVQQNGLLERES